jgi:hypothetical protein
MMRRSDFLIACDLISMMSFVVTCRDMFQGIMTQLAF